MAGFSPLFHKWEDKITRTERLSKNFANFLKRRLMMFSGFALVLRYRATSIRVCWNARQWMRLNNNCKHVSLIIRLDFTIDIDALNGSHCNKYESCHRFSQERESRHDVSSSLTRIENPGPSPNQESFFSFLFFFFPLCDHPCWSNPFLHTFQKYLRISIIEWRNVQDTQKMFEIERTFKI